MSRLEAPTRRESVATLAVAVAAALAAVAFARMARIDPPPDARSSPLVRYGASADSASGAVHAPAARAADAALASDPFDPERRSPYAEPVAPAEGPAERPVGIELVRLLGTVVLPEGGGFVVYQLPSEVPKTVRTGERIGVLTLISVFPGRALFEASDGSRVELHLSVPGT